MGSIVIVNRALPIHHTATEDSAWDGPAAVAAMPNDAATLRYCHAWFDSSDGRDGDDGSDGDRDADGDLKSNYKFPHHKSKGGPANLAACRNGLARLSGAAIPDADRAGVKAHLQAHLDDANKGSNNMETIVNRMRSARPMARLVEGKRDWYRIENKSNGAADIHIYDEIGYLGVTAADFVNELQSIRASTINLHINSPGGEVFDGIAIYNGLKNHPANIVVYIDALAASAASFIAMAGDKVIMQKTASMMIHDGMGMAIGNSSEMRTLADLLDKTSNTIASIYADKTNTPIEQWRNAMLAETWYNADEAVAAGLADEIQGGRAKSDAPDMTATWDLSIFKYRNRTTAPEVTATSSPSDVVAGTEVSNEVEDDAFSADIFSVLTEVFS
jgi:ATP-dependent protease ClpP protease subunit